MSLRDEAMQALGDGHDKWSTSPILNKGYIEAWVLDALLDWLDTNAERIAADPTKLGSAFKQTTAGIHWLVNVLRDDAK